MAPPGHGTTLWISGVQAADNRLEPVDGESVDGIRAKEKPPEGGLSRSAGNGAQAVSPSTVTVMSTTTSVCSATDTVLSLTVLIGPLGMRTWALATL